MITQYPAVCVVCVCVSGAGCVCVRNVCVVWGYRCIMYTHEKNFWSVKNKHYRKKKKEKIAEDGFDPSTSGLWAQHAPTAPLCLTAYSTQTHSCCFAFRNF